MAYIILCHKNPNQVNILIDSLNHENIDFFIHVDKKSNILPRIKRGNNIYFINNPIEIQWGHISQIECILKGFSLVRETGHYDYIHIISGQDLPLKEPKKIIEFFSDNNGKEYIEYVQMPQGEARWGYYDRISVYYPNFLISRDRIKAGIRRRYTKFIMSNPRFKRKIDVLPKNLYKGANWMSITFNCMQYILDFTSENPEYVEFFKHTFCGDEIFFQSIIMNSPFKHNTTNEILRYIDWKSGPDFPRTLTSDDISQLEEAKLKCLWARKFDMDVEKKVIDKLLSSNWS